MSLVSCDSVSIEENLSSQQALILKLAASFDCVCQQDSSGFWQILPHATGAVWRLQQIDENCWLLVVRGQPQINLLSSEVFTFLNRQKLRKS